MRKTVGVNVAAKLVLKTLKAWERSFSGTREEENAAYATHMEAIKVYGLALQDRAEDARAATKNELAADQSLGCVGRPEDLISDPDVLDAYFRS